MLQSHRLPNNTALVTGGGTGIGKAIALRLAGNGYRVAVAGRRPAPLHQTVQQIQSSGGHAIAIQADISNELQARDLIRSADQKLGGLGVLVNNAALLAGSGEFLDLDSGQFRKVMETNLSGTFFCCQEAYRLMKRAGGGAIINISSVAGVQAWAGTGAYSASKHGVMALTGALADEARAHNIRVSAICPGGVANELVDSPPEEIASSGKISPYDVADTVLFLLNLSPNTIIRQIVLDRMGADW